MWAPGEEVVFAEDHVLPGQFPGYTPLELNKLYIVKSTHEVPPENNGVGCCECCGNDKGIRVFGVEYMHTFANCANEFRKPLTIEDEVIMKVTENA